MDAGDLARIIGAFLRKEQREDRGLLSVTGSIDIEWMRETDGHVEIGTIHVSSYTGDQFKITIEAVK